MIVWHQPKANQGNFLPWFEQSLLAQRRQIHIAFAVLLIVSMALLAPLCWQYYLWQQAKTHISDASQSGRLFLQQQQQNSWLALHATQQIQSNVAMRNRLQHSAWEPAQELSTLVGNLSSPQQLSSWKWTESDGQIVHIEFVVDQLEAWQPWWRIWLQTRPSAKIIALDVGPEGVSLRVQYLVSHMQAESPISRQGGIVETMPNKTGDYLALRPPFSNHNLPPLPPAGMVQLVSHLSTRIEVSPAHDSLQLTAQLAPALWGALAPLPSGVGWVLKNLSLLLEPSGKWRLTISWKTDPLLEEQSGINRPVSLDQQTSIRLALANLAVEAEQVQAVSPAGFFPPLLVNFIGYSEQLNDGSVAWLRHVDNGQVVRLKLGQSVAHWRLVVASTQQVTLQQGEHELVLQRKCLTGVCP